MINILKGKYKTALIVCTVFLMSFVYLRIYVVTELQGDFNKHFLPAEMFGVPGELKNKGIETLYKNSGETGWDGQFHYYISNDIFGIKDTPAHIDADAYRYQRIGLPILANIISKIAFQEYVSPFVYYVTSLLIILSATFVFCLFLQSKGCSQILSLFWSMSLGVQLTLMNGLPDAAADGLLIIALLAWLKKRDFLFSICAMLAALSREAYILFPFVLCIFSIYDSVKNKDLNPNNLIMKNIYFLMPGLVFLTWHLYIRWHFGVSPSEQAQGILNYPFFSFAKYLYFAFHNAHPLNKDISSSELVYLILFFVLLFLIVKIAILTFARVDERTKPVNIFFILLVGLYVCFGDTVMMHHTGYMKASSIFFFAIVLYHAINARKIKLKTMCFLLFCLFLFNYALVQRIHPQHISHYDKQAKYIKELPERADCIGDYKYNVRILESNDLIEKSFINQVTLKLLSKESLSIKNIELTNLSSKSYPVTRGFGTVNMSYLWIDEKGKVIKDGIRTRLPAPLNPGDTIALEIVVEENNSKDSELVLSPVQEGCAWFYQVKK